MKNVEMRKLPRFFAKGCPRSFGTRRSAYKWLAKKQITREFDHLPWDSDAGIASLALQAFRKKWCDFDGHDSFYPTMAYHCEVKRIVERMMKEDEE